MRLELARTAGFCYGVRRAVHMAEEAAQSGRPCVMLGPIIHNQSVIAYLKDLGVGMVDTPEEVPEGAAVIIRSHGECRAVHEALSSRGLRVIDATCPNVSRIHQIVAQAAGGYHRHTGPSGGQGHRRLVQTPCCGGRALGIGGVADRKPQKQGKNANPGGTNHFNSDNLGIFRRKNEKRVYKRKNF